VTDKPIIFSAPMVRALLAGTKTQTRRLLKPPYGTLEWLGNNQWRPICTKVFPGDRLWVREAHSLHHAHGQGRRDGKRWGPWGGLPTTGSPDGTQIAYYREGFDRCDHGRWRPSIHMPRWASRLTLIVTDVRVQRLAEISEEDARAEGAPPFGGDSADASRGVMASGHAGNYRATFRDIWNTIHGPGAWDANPWVAALTFTVHRQNIDQMEPTK
jgi:hypothetical protein